MNTLRNILIGAVAVSALATSAFAQVSAVGSAQTDAKIIQPLTIATTSTMNFGTVTKPTSSTASVVAVATNGTRSITGGTSVGAAGATPTAAAFTVSGEPALTYAITTPATFSLSSGAASLTITPALSKTTGTLAAGGTDTFTVGGSMSITDATVTGAYTGSLSVTVAYN